MDFVVSSMENYYQRRIRHFTSSHDSRPYLLLEYALRKAAAISSNDVYKIDDDFYAVKSESTDGLYYIDPKLGLCSCPAGSFGAFCKHQAALYRSEGVGLPNMPAISLKDRYEMAKLASGESVQDPRFYRNLDVRFFAFFVLLVLNEFFRRYPMLVKYRMSDRAVVRRASIIFQRIWILICHPQVKRAFKTARNQK